MKRILSLVLALSMVLGMVLPAGAAEVTEDPVPTVTEIPAETVPVTTDACTGESAEEPAEIPTEEPDEEPSEIPTEDPDVDPVEIPTEMPADGSGEIAVTVPPADENTMQSEVAPMATTASGTCGADLTWTLDDSGRLTISGTGAMDNFSAYSRPWYSYNQQITSIVILEGVTSIGNYAFRDCTAMTAVSLPSTLVQLGESAFFNCTALTGIDFPGQLAVIGNSAFYYCTALARITFPSGLNTLGSTAFYGCTALTDICFTGSAPVISSNAFYAVTATVSYPSEDPSWAGTAGRDFGGFLTWTPPADGVLVEGSCGETLTWRYNALDKSLMILGSGAMYDFEAGSAPWSAYAGEITSLKLNSGITYLGSCAFLNLQKLTSVSLPDSVSGVGIRTFEGCRGIAFSAASSNKSFEVIDGALYSKGGYILYSAPSVSGEFELNKYTSQIRDYAFSGNTKITALRAPAGNGITTYGLRKIGTRAFSGCAGLKRITFLGNAPTIAEDAFLGVTATAEYLSGTNGWDTCAGSNYGGSITWQSSQVTASGTFSGGSWILTADGTMSFYAEYGGYSIPGGCNPSSGIWYNYRDQIKQVVIPRQFNELAAYAFYDCKNLVSVSMPGIYKVGANAFCNCLSLKKVYLYSSNTVSVGNYAFSGCSALEEVSLGIRSSLGEYAFSGCSNLKEIYFNSAQRSTSGNFTAKTTSFQGVTADVLCPYGMQLGTSQLGGTLTYKNVDYGTCGENVRWSYDTAGAILTITGTGAITEYTSGSYTPWTFRNSSIASIQVSEGITELPSYAFEYCAAATRITLPQTLTSIAPDAFNDCAKLNNLLIPSGVTYFTTDNFCRCYALTDIYYLGTEEQWNNVTNASLLNVYADGWDEVDTTYHFLRWHQPGATCTEPGTEGYYGFEDTSVYSHMYNSSWEAIDQLGTVGALGHDLGPWESAAPATCQKEGTETSTCTRCSYFETRTTPITDHSYAAQEVSPTCTEQGYTAYTCSYCGKSYADNYVDALGHTGGTATCKSGPVCNVCGVAYGEPSAHAYENGFCALCDSAEPAVDSDGDSFYEIGNAGQLYWFARKVDSGENAMSAVLTANIIVNTGDVAGCGGAKQDAWRTWDAIGSYSRIYSGTFDGQGHTISGLYYEANPYREEEYYGLFAYSNGTIRNVGLVNTYFDAWTYFGGIVGYNYGTVEKCYFSGTIEGYESVGGIVGYNYGTVRNCYNLGSVSGSLAVGGIAGTSYQPLDSCYNTGTVKAYLYSCGGIAGKGRNITNCYYLKGCASDGVSVVQNGIGNSTKGSTTPDDSAMTVGFYDSELRTGAITWVLNRGVTDGTQAFYQTLNQGYPEFAGQTVYYGYSDCKDTTKELSNEFRSDPAQHRYENGVCTVCGDGCSHGALESAPATDNGDGTHSYSCSACGQVFSQDHAGGKATCSQPARCDRCGAAYGETDSTNHDASAGYDSNGFCANGCYQPAEPVEDYYEIANAGQLYWFAQQVNSGNTDIRGELTAHIVVNKNVLADDGTLNPGNYRSWTPIGNQSNLYTGYFDGAGFTVSGLFCVDNGNYMGLFGYSGGIICNVTLLDSCFKGKWMVGGIAGSHSGIISDCSSYAQVTGEEYVGGIVGYNRGSVENSENYGRITGTECVGGIVGYNGSGTVSGCCNEGLVTAVSNGYDFIGGIAGDNGNGTLRNCCNLASVSGNEYIGGVTGSCNTKGTVTGCYSIGQITGSGYTGGVVSEYTAGTVTDCYYLSTCGAKGKGTSKTAEQFASGEVAWLLNGGSSVGDWKQTIGQDSAPNFTGMTVFQATNCNGDTVYVNTAENLGHQWENGVCTVCDKVCSHSDSTTSPVDLGDGTHGFTCTVCSLVVSEAHSGGTATCVERATCHDCNAVYGEPDPGNHVGETQLRDQKDPTCIEEGFTGDTWCLSCHAIATPGEVIPAAGHSYEDGKCTVCGEIEILGSGTCGEDLTWMLDIYGVLHIFGSGKMTDYTDTNSASMPPWYDLRDLVKEIDLGSEVTSIGNYAFVGCRNLVTVDIPDNITRIGSCAFYACSGLRHVYIPESVQVIYAPFTDDSPFYYCSEYLVICCGSSAKPSGWDSNWTRISGSARLTAFYGCSREVFALWKTVDWSAASIVIPEGITRIPEYAFANRTHITTIRIPDTVTTIERYAFQNCTGLKYVYIPASVTEIPRTYDGYLFSGCSVDMEIFCEADSKPEAWDNGWSYYNSSNALAVRYGASRAEADLWATVDRTAATVVLPEGITRIWDKMFTGSKTLTAITFPETLTRIDENAFRYCTQLQSVTIPHGVTQLGSGVFYGCTGLTSVELGEGITAIGSYAFYDCTGLTSLRIPGSVNRIGEYAFSGCTGLKTVHTDSIASWLNISFANSSHNTGSLIASSNPLCNGGDLYVGGSLLTELVIPEGITRINDFAFYGCDDLRSVYIPDTVTSIGHSAFYGCSGLKTLFIPESVQTISAISSTWAPFNGCSTEMTLFCEAGEKAAGWEDYWNCPAYGQFLVVCYNSTRDEALYWDTLDKSASVIYLRDGITRIPKNAFKNCTTLTDIVIPDSVTEICNNAFQNCTGLKYLYIPASVQTIECYDERYSPIFGCNDQLMLFCEADSKPAGWDEDWNCYSIRAYSQLRTFFDTTRKDAQFWGTLDCSSSVVDIPEGVTMVPKKLFYERTTLKKVLFSGTVTRIEDSAFAFCSNLESPELPDGLVRIGADAFRDCEKISSIFIPASVAYIESGYYGPFYSCHKDLQIYCEAEEVPSGWCRDWYYVLSDSQLHYYMGCTRLDEQFWSTADRTAETVVIPLGVTIVPNNAFYKQAGLQNVVIPDSVRRIGHYAFENCTALRSVEIPESVTKIGVLAFGYCSSLQEIRFRGNAPEIRDASFAYATMTAWYPAGNDTWTDSVMTNYGGTVTWRPYCVTEHTEVIDPAVAPTCTQTGLTEGKHCTACHEVLIAQEVIPALGHFVGIDVAVAPTCTETGLTEGQYCCVCHEVLVAQEIIPALGHTEVIDPAVASTCTETGLTEGKHCSVCSEVLTAQETVPANGHTEAVDEAVAPTCTQTGLTEGKHCSVCDEVLISQEEIPMTGHDYIAHITSPSCTEGGYTTYICSTCGDSYMDNHEDALGHDYVDDVCSRCGQVNDVPAKPYKIANVVSGVHVYWKETAGAAKYGLWRSETGKDGTYKWIANPTVPHFTDTKVQSGKTYFYKVTSMDAAGNHSEKSEPIGITYVSTPDITSRTNIAAGVKLGWEKITGATGYAIYRKSYSGTDAWVRVGTISGNETFTWTDTSVKNNNGTVYKYTIRALAGSDMKTLSGCRNAGRTMARLSSQVLTSATKASSTSIKCQWTTSGRVTGYEVRFTGSDGSVKTFTVGNWKTGVKTFTGLKSGQTYTIQVRTYLKVDGMGFYSDWSTAKNVTI